MIIEFSVNGHSIKDIEAIAVPCWMTSSGTLPPVNRFNMLSACFIETFYLSQ
jgi:hypothetical protein